MLSDEELSDEAVLPPLLLTLEFPVFPVVAEVVPLLVVPELPLLPELLLELLRERGVDMPEEKLTDCGASLYYDWQDAHAGGSGAGCIAATTCARLLDEVREGAKQRLLLVGSGALLSWTSAQQGESIPGIAFAATLEGK